MSTNKKENLTYIDAIRKALFEEMKNDNKVVLFGEDIGVYGGAFGVTKGLIDEFGEKRIIDTPISENSIVGMATGASITGLRPVVEIMFMDFITLAMDQIVNHLAKLRYIYGGQVELPVVIRLPAGAGRRYGASHSQCLEAWLAHIPGLRIAVPSNANDAYHLLKHAIKSNDPWMFIEGKKLYFKKSGVNITEKLKIGEPVKLSSGNDLTLISYSTMTNTCKEVRENLKKTVSIDHLDLRTLSPLNYSKIYKSVRKTGNVLIVEEANSTCGFGAEISSKIHENCFKFLSKPCFRIGGLDIPIPASASLEDVAIPSFEKVRDEIIKACKGN